MADPTDDEGPSWMPGAETFGKLKGEWDNFLEQPGAKTALLQFGINMMQPPSFGDTGMSQFGRAVGAAGEAVTRQQEIERKEFESEAKAEAAFARAQAAQARAERAGTSSELGWERLRHQQNVARGTQEHRQTRGQMDAMRAYLTYRRDTEKLNAADDKAWNDPTAALLRPKGAVKSPPRRILSEEEFYASPLWRHYMGRVGAGGVVPAATTPEETPSPAPSPTPLPAPPSVPGGTSGTGARASPTLTGRGAPEGAVVEVTTPEEARRLPPGTRYKRPNDPVIYRIPKVVP